MIQLPLTAEEFTAKAALLEQQHGIAFTGHEGTITKMGVTVHYHFANDLLEIDILDKPFFLTADYCEEQLKTWLGVPT